MNTRWTAIALAVVVIGCAAPATTPASNTPTASGSVVNSRVPVTPVPPASAVLTPGRTSEPRPTEPPRAVRPPIRVVAQPLEIAPSTALIEVVGRYRTDTETAVRSWMPFYLEILDKYRNDSNEINRSMFESTHAPGPYTELIRRSLQPWFGPPGMPAPKRAFTLERFTIEHMYAKPWGRVAYIDATLSYVDVVTAADGTMSSTRHSIQGRWAHQGQGQYKLLDGYDPILGRWVGGELPRWSALGLQAEAPIGVGWVLERESYVPGDPYPHGTPATGRFLNTPFDNAWNDTVLKLDASFSSGEFKTRRFDDVEVRVTHFAPATYLGDGVVTAVVSGRLVTAAAGAAERSSPITRTLKFYRITRDGLMASWMPVDEQGPSGTWLSGGDLALSEIDQDRG
jgi:hypothetical protein